MTRRSINLIQFWLTIAFFAIPGIAFYIASYVRFQSGVFDKIEVDYYAYFGFTILVTLLWALVVEHLRVNRIVTLVTLQTGVMTAALATLYCTLLSLSLLFCYRTINFPRGFVFVGCSLMFLLSFCLIHLFRAAIHKIDKSPNGRFPVAVLGADELPQAYRNDCRRVDLHVARLLALLRCRARTRQPWVHPSCHGIAWMMLQMSSTAVRSSLHCHRSA